MVAVSVEVVLGAPAVRARLTVTGLGIGESVVSVWRAYDDTRDAVSGYRRVPMNDAAVLTDFYAPLGRPVTYEVEVISGPDGSSRTYSEPVTLDSTTGFLMDALVPQTAIPIVGGHGPDGTPYLRAKALAALEYTADVSIFKIMGSSKPMALFGQRMAEMGLDTSVGTRSAEENAKLKRLLSSTAQLVFRPLPSWGSFELPGVMFLANATATQLPVDIGRGGSLTWWDLVSDVVQAPAIRVLTAEFTYGDVQILMDTYGQKQDLMAGKTYLDDLKNPLGG